MGAEIDKKLVVNCLLAWLVLKLSNLAESTNDSLIPAVRISPVK